jgi:Zn-dependent M28 family amino/carboxypeptidase
MKRLTSLALAALAGFALVLSQVVGQPAQAAPPPPVNNTPAKLTKAVTLPGVLSHLAALQVIAARNNGTRASGTPGFDRSADYVAARLKQAGYQVTRQNFEFPYFQNLGPSNFAQTAPTATQYTLDTDYSVLDFSGSGTATGAVVPVDVSLTPPRASTSGCEAADFAGFPSGGVALVQRGTCPFGDKATNAAAAGASAVIIFNQGNGTPEENPDRYERFEGTLGGPVSIPAISISYALGESLANTAGLTVTITTNTLSETRTTQNVIADSPGGLANNVVMSGAHLDSVLAGPGINDNGTGSATLLEIALQASPRYGHVVPKNKLRFAWWGAEESGLLGSEHYVTALTPQQIQDIGLYLNFDMVGSPNYQLAVYDGDDSAADGAGPGPEGSTRIEQIFREFYTSRGKQAVDTDFDGRSDYGPFIAEGVDIPSGGLFTGAEGIKTDAEVALFGGVPGVAYDPCYHQKCDSFTPVKDGVDTAVYDKIKAAYGKQIVGNLNVYALDLNADAIATAVITLAFNTTGVSTPAGPVAATASAQRKSVPSKPAGPVDAI